MNLLDLLLLSVGASIALVGGTTTILTFSDSNCTSFVESLEGEDGFPSGECANFKDQSASSYSSFMVNTLDAGCSITIYGSDMNDLICSSTLAIEAHRGECYNSSWQYYSVDMCTPLITSSSSSSSTSLSTSTIPPATSIVLLPTSITLFPTSTTTQGPAQTTTSSDSASVAAIAGGSVAGTLVLVAIAVTAAYYFWWRPKMTKTKDEGAVRDKSLGLTYGSDRMESSTISEAPWQSERPLELTSDHIVEAP